MKNDLAEVSDAGPLRLAVCGAAGGDAAALLGRLLPADRTARNGLAVETVRTTRDLLAGAARADLALIAVADDDAPTAGALHDAAIAALLGVRRIVFAVEGAADRFHEIEHDLAARAATLGIAHVVSIPDPPVAGGLTLDELIDTAAPGRADRGAFRFLVAEVGCDESGATRCTGSVLGGAVAAGERVRLWPSRAEATVAGATGGTGDAVTLALDGEVAAAPGDIVTEAADGALALADQLQAALIWLADEPLVPGRRYWARLGAAECGAEVTTLKHRLDFRSGAEVAARALARDEVGVATLTLDQPMPFDSYGVNRTTGALALLDSDTGAEVGFGVIEYALRRATNVVWHDTAVDKAARAGLKGQKPVCLWFTGLSGSGKSTVANMVDKRLTAERRHTYVLDGDNIRHGLNHDLGFTEADRVENIRRMAEVARLMVDAGLIVMVCAISPYRQDREMARGLFADGEFIEVFVDTPLGECEQRDPKGLYRKARAGQIPNFTGISAPYEPPDAPEIHLDGTQPIEALVERVFAKLG